MKDKMKEYTLADFQTGIQEILTLSGIIADPPDA